MVVVIGDERQTGHPYEASAPTTEQDHPGTEAPADPAADTGSEAPESEADEAGYGHGV